MDDALREKILASLDLPPDSASDPAVARALDRDPEARSYAASLYRVDRALRSWPLRERSEAAWTEAEERVLAAVEADAKAGSPARVPDGETDDLAPPAFDDDASPMETRPAMSEPNEHDPDFESLAALTRTSLAPGAVPSARPRPASPIADAVDDTSSGIVDIKQLSAIARDAAASVPAPSPLAVAEVSKAAAPSGDAEKPRPATEAKPAAKKDDVMVTARPAAVVAVEAPRRSGGGPMWAIGGMAVMAGAFLLFNANRDSAPTSPSAVESNAPATSVPEAVPVTAPVALALPSGAPAAEPPSESAHVVAEPSPTPAAPRPDPVAAPQAVAQVAAARPEREREPSSAHRAPSTRSSAPSAPAVAAPAPARPAAAAPPPPGAPAPTTAPAAAPRGAAGAPAAPAAGRNTSVDDLLNRAAPAATPAAAAAVAPAAPAADVPERLNRAQITGVLGPLNGAVRSCAQGQTGTAPVAMVIGNDGAVRSATVSGQFAGTPVGDCIAGVVRRAHFPAFRAATQNLMFPYVITPPVGH